MTRSPSEPGSVAGVRLRLRWRPTPNLPVVLLVVAAALAALELIGRVDGWAPEPARVPSLPVLDHKLARLETLRDQVECVIAGGRAVYAGIAPSGIERGAAVETRPPVRCYNLGLPGATVMETAEILGILRSWIAPSLVVVGVTVAGPREATPLLLDEKAQQEPWLRLHRGRPSLDGWLIEHSAAYRRVLRARHAGFASLWGSGDQTLRQDAERRLLSRTARDGFLESGPGSAAPPGARIEILVSEPAIDALAKLVQRFPPGHVAVLTLPLSPEVARVLQERPDLERVTAAFADRMRRVGAPLWQPDTPGLREATAWQDAEQLSATGVEALSRWLGRMIADHRGVAGPGARSVASPSR